MLKTNIKDLQKDDVLLVSIDFYNANKEKLKGIPLAITSDGKPPIEPKEEFEHFEEKLVKEIDLLKVEIVEEKSEIELLKERVEYLESLIDGKR